MIQSNERAQELATFTTQLLCVGICWIDLGVDLVQSEDSISEKTLEKELFDLHMLESACPRALLGGYASRTRP